MKLKRFKNIPLRFGGATIGAAFLMANSSIGPGFLTQTSVYTEKLLTSFGFVILVSVLFDIGAQLNTWRILAVSNKRAQDVANTLVPGLGYVLSGLVVFGGFAFNIGNIAGTGLALNVLFGISFEQDALVSGAFALLLFFSKEIGKMLDRFTQVLGVLKIGLTLFIAYAAHAPLAKAIQHTVMPEKISLMAIVTIVGGTVGGYLTFSGAHRLIDAGVVGQENVKKINNSALSGIFISTLMRFILFLAVVGVVSQGVVLDTNNPAATVFQTAAGHVGYLIFGIVLWSAALSSVVGAAYTSISFCKTFHPSIQKNERWYIVFFIVVSTLVYLLVGKPKELLLFAGLVNGCILPLAVGIILIAVNKKSFIQNYKHPLWMQLLGWVVVIGMGWMSILAILE